jgi:hypothetical protein
MPPTRERQAGDVDEEIGVRTFNTPLESGLRALFVLAAARRRAFDTQRLVYFDYLLVHSAEVDGPESLHPRSPAQKGELLVRRALLQDGLDLMRSRDLIERRFKAGGIAYAATTAGANLVSEFESDYAALLRERAAWVVETFAPKSDQALADLLGARVTRWDDELIADAAPGTEHAAR